MKILFVCKANVGRSQMAEAIFSKKSKDHEVSSAGISPGEWEGKKLSETKCVKVCLSEIGIDVNEKISKKLTKEMVQDADKVIAIVEKYIWPDFLENSEKVVFWKIADPKEENLEFHRKTLNEISQEVEDLIKSLDESPTGAKLRSIKKQKN